MPPYRNPSRLPPSCAKTFEPYAYAAPPLDFSPDSPAAYARAAYTHATLPYAPPAFSPDSPVAYARAAYARATLPYASVPTSLACPLAARPSTHLRHTAPDLPRASRRRLRPHARPLRRPTRRPVRKSARHRPSSRYAGARSLRPM